MAASDEMSFGEIGQFHAMDVPVMWWRVLLPVYEVKIKNSENWRLLNDS